MMLTREEDDLLERFKKPLFPFSMTYNDVLAYINKKYNTNYKSLREYNIASGFVRYLDNDK